MMGRLGVARFCVVVLLFVVLWGIGGGGSVQGQALSGAWTIRAYEGVEDTLQRWYSIAPDKFFFADTSLGIAYWYPSTKDSTRIGAWRRTTDGGATWQLFSVTGIRTDIELTSGRFALQGAHGVVVMIGYAGAMTPYLTSDSGHTWAPAPLPTLPVWEVIADELRPTLTEGIRNIATIHAIGGSNSFKALEVSTDIGASWRRIDSTLFSGLPDSVRSRATVFDLHWLRDTVLTLSMGIIDTGLSFVYNPELWDVGLSGTLLRRTPLPDQLRILYYNPGTASARSIRLSDSVWMFLYSFNNVRHLSITADAGRSWTTLPQSQPFPYGTFYPTATRQMRSNSISDDTGSTARVWAAPYGVGRLVVLDSLHWITLAGSVIDSFTWRASAINVIAQTNDGGRTWQYKSGYRRITAMQVAGGTVLLTSPLHRMLRSRDRGETYEDVTDGLPPGVITFTSLRVRDPDQPQKMAAVAIDASFEMGERQVLLASDDAGATWELVRDLTSLGRGRVNNLQFVRRTDVPGSIAGWLTSDSGMSITTDGGLTWADRTNLKGPFTMIDERFGWTAGDTTIMRTSDGGLTWKTVYTAPIFYRHLQGFKVFDSLRAVALVPSVMIPPYWKRATTSDGGRTWDTVKLSITFPYTLGRYIWINSRTLYLIDEGKMWLSRDGAMSFAAETPDTSGWQRGTLDRRTIYFFGKGAVGRWDITDTSLSDVPTQLLPLVASKQLQIEALRGGFIAHLAPNNEEYRLELYNIAGHLVQRRDLRRGETDIRVDDLVAGWYSLRLVSQSNAVVDGSVVVTQ
jgi:photosystem II stability/assembly factor-like uncharacterized protein